jgi:predicted transcriptional regulator
MAFEIRDLAEEIHFTLPESVWQAKGDFFKSFGFNASLVSEKQYRLFDRELRCSARFSDVWTSVLDRVPKLSSYYSFGGVSPKGNIVLSIKPIFAERILSGKKRIEIRRKFSTRWVGHRLNLYSSAPEMSLVGEATISGVITGTPTEIWERFGTEIGCSKEEFLGYVKGASQIYAIELAEVRRYRSPISLAQMSFLARETLCPPQSYFALENNKPWSKAVSIAAYLHASLSTVVRTLYGCDRRLVETQPLGVQADFKLR